VKNDTNIEIETFVLGSYRSRLGAYNSFLIFRLSIGENQSFLYNGRINDTSFGLKGEKWFNSYCYKGFLFYTI